MIAQSEADPAGLTISSYAAGIDQHEGASRQARDREADIGQSLHQEPAYAASKGAIRIFTKVTASQHARDRIRCNSVHPGPVDTEMFHSAFRDREAMERRLQRVPLQRMGTVAEIVAAVLFLASDDSSYMTGSELVIDGGALAQ